MQSAINQDSKQIVMNNKKIIVARDVAKEAGCSLSTVYAAFTKSTKTSACYKEETLKRVREVAKNIGYDPYVALTHGKGLRMSRGWKASTSGNFTNREEETNRMLYLRSRRAMTNQEISKTVGVSYMTVLKRIGPQPKELTEMSFALRGERVSRRNQARKNILLSQKIAQFETFRKEAEAIDAKARELELQAQRIADEAKAVREQYSAKVVELDAYRKEAEKAAAQLGRTLA